MTTRERVRRALTGELPDRIPLCEISIWPETMVRWKQEGMPEDADVLAWLGMDRLVGSGVDCSLQLPEETLEEDEETVTVRDKNGAVERRWKTRTGVRRHVDHLVKTPDDWREYRDRLAPSPDRVAANYGEVLARSQEEDFWLYINPSEPIWWALMLMGFEEGLPMMADHPDVVDEMMAYQVRLSLEALDTVMAIGKPDALWYFSDLCYSGGMLFSPRMFRELVLPHLKRVTDACWERDVVPMIHCCGDKRQFIPLLIEAGFACAQPLEARCGNDVRELKPLYGEQITLFGNISVDRLSGSLEEAEEEVTSKLEVAVPGGRYIYHSDHSVPPSVPLANYRRALDLAREMGSYE